VKTPQHLDPVTFNTRYPGRIGSTD